MKRTSVTAAKNGLSALLDRVRHGESILIEDRGIPIALLNPVTSTGGGADRDLLTRLERHGIVRPAASLSKAKRLALPPPRPRKAVSLSARVVAERGEGW
jgi:antitoxin (DNA-binding transcriptional repressor) of toxin-antitoxin stability system